MTEEFIKSALDGRFWWVDEFNTVRVRQVPTNFIPRHTIANGVPSADPVPRVHTPRRDKATHAVVPILGTQPATPAAAERIIAAVAALTGVTVQTIQSRAKEAVAWKARHVAYYVVRATTGLSYPRIGEIFRRDHTTIQNGVWRVQIDPGHYEPELSKAMAMFGKKEAA